ncbi:Putative aldehyde dehydrogenase SA1924 [Raoultella ornithinolytica]|nr:Putative aldehyde dehydrogenase SA1924 [Raoultella ornithinolytica]
MLHIDKIYINGEFVTPHGSETFALFNPATEEVIGQARLADEEDARRAIAAAKSSFSLLVTDDETAASGCP